MKEFEINIGHYRRLKGAQIYSAFNLQCATAIVNGDLHPDESFIFWCDGFFGKKILRLPQHIPGRRVVEHIISDTIYAKILFLGVSQRDLEILKNNYAVLRLKTTLAVELPIAAPDVIYKECSTVNLTHWDIALICLPTPKQEQVAQLLIGAKNFPACGFVCAGGAINMLVGKERPAPDLISRLGFEWLWRFIFGGDKRRRGYRIIKIIMALRKIRHSFVCKV